MFNNTFSTREYDLDGPAFKHKFETTENAELIDVRASEEFCAGTIPGARNLDLTAADFLTRVRELDPDKTYFLFCRTGNRSAGAASLFKKRGLKSYNLLGGIGAWPR